MGEAVTKARVTLREEQRTYSPQVREQVTGPDDVCGLLWDHVFATAPREKFVACLLNTANVVQTFVVVAKGTINSTIISPRKSTRPLSSTTQAPSSALTITPRATPSPAGTTFRSPVRSGRRGRP